MPKRILVAENDKLNMRLFHDVLTHRGYETIEIEDGLDLTQHGERAYTP